MFVCEPNHEWVVDCSRWQRKEGGSRSSSVWQSLTKADECWRCNPGVEGGCYLRGHQLFEEHFVFNIIQRTIERSNSRYSGLSHEDWTHHRRDGAKVEAMGMCQHGSSQPQLAAIDSAELAWGPGSWTWGTRKRHTDSGCEGRAQILF